MKSLEDAPEVKTKLLAFFMLVHVRPASLVRKFPPPPVPTIALLPLLDKVTIVLETGPQLDPFLVTQVVPLSLVT